MDSFLRLKDPNRRSRRRSSLSTCSILLWLGASWAISLVQSIAQFMLSQADRHVIQNGVCFVGDRNFAILGTLFSFIIPVSVAVLFHVLCHHELKNLKKIGTTRSEECGDDVASTGYRYDINPSIDNSDDEEEDDDISDTTSCVSRVSHDTLRHDTPRVTSDVPPLCEQLQLAVVTNIKNGDVNENDVTRSDVTSFCYHNNETKKIGDVPTTALTSSDTNFVEHILSTDQSSSCTLLLRDGREEEEILRANQMLGVPDNELQNVLECHVLRRNADVDHSPPDEILRQEQALSRLLLVLLIVCISLWTPFSISNVFYAVCRRCRLLNNTLTLTLQRCLSIKWLAYLGAALVPLIYLKCSVAIRNAYVKIFTCDKSIWYKRFK